MLAPLRVRDFRLLFIGLVAGQAMMPLQFVSQIFWVQTNAAVDSRIVLVGAIATVRGAGMLLFGLYGGALADRFNRRRLLIATQSAVIPINLLIALVMYRSPADSAGLTVFFALTFVTAGLAAVDAPTRQALVPDLLGPRLTPGGISLNAAGMQVSMPVSMFAAGFLAAAFGFAGAYAFGVIGNAVQVVTLLLMGGSAAARPARTASSGFRQTFRDVREGIAYTRGNRTVLWVIVLLLVMTGLGTPAVANLGPTWITTVVNVPVRNFGFVAATWGIGAFLASVMLARYASFERRGLVIAFGAIAFALSFLVFAIGSVPAAVIGNFGLGASLAATNVSAAALIQHLVPNEVRGRVLSILLVNRGLAQLVTLPLAALGGVISLRTLFPLLALVVLALVVLIVVAQPSVRRARISAAEPAPASAAGD